LKEIDYFCFFGGDAGLLPLTGDELLLGGLLFLGGDLFLLSCGEIDRLDGDRLVGDRLLLLFLGGEDCLLPLTGDELLLGGLLFLRGDLSLAELFPRY